MAFQRLKFTKNWLSPADFPTEQDSEPQVRADLQLLHDEAKDGLNKLMTELEAGTAAHSLGAQDETGAPSTVQRLLTRLTTLFSGVTRLDRTLEGETGQNAVPTSAAVQAALDAVVTGDLRATGVGYILQNVWLATRHTPEKKHVKTETTFTVQLCSCGATQYEEGTGLEARVWRTRSLTVDDNGSLIPGAVEPITVAKNSQALAGWYWCFDDTFSIDNTRYTPENTTVLVTYYGSDVDTEPLYELSVVAARVSVEENPSQTGETELLYGDPGAYPASGYGENPAAAPYEGYLYQALGPFKHLPFYAGSGGGNVTVLAPDTVLYVPQTLTEAQQAQARANIGAAAVGMGGMDTDEIVAAVLAALPIAEEAEF